MRWVKWLWPIAALVLIAVYYAVGAFAMTQAHSIDVPGFHGPIIWPHGRLGLVGQVFWSAP